MANEKEQQPNRFRRSPQEMQDVDFMPPLSAAVPLGFQHVLAMFVGNVSVPLIIAAAIDLPAAETLFLVQTTMFAAGIKMLASVPFNQRNMLIIGVSLAVAIGLRDQRWRVCSPERVLDQPQDCRSNRWFASGRASRTDCACFSTHKLLCGTLRSLPTIQRIGQNPIALTKKRTA